MFPLGCFDLSFDVAADDPAGSTRRCRGPSYVPLKLRCDHLPALFTVVVSAVPLPAGRLHAGVGPLRLFQRAEDQIPADPHLAHALDR